MPVRFTLDLPTSDQVEAKRLAAIVRKVRCDVHGEMPTRVRLTSPTPDRRSVLIEGCCPQLYVVVTDRLAQGPSDGGTQRGAPPAPRRRPPAF